MAQIDSEKKGATYEVEHGRVMNGSGRQGIFRRRQASQSFWRAEDEEFKTQAGLDGLMSAESEAQERAKRLELNASMLNEELSVRSPEIAFFPSVEDLRFFDDPGAHIIHWGINE